MALLTKRLVCMIWAYFTRYSTAVRRSSTDVCAQPSAAQGVMLLATMMCMVWSCMAHSNHKLLEEACLTYFRGPVKDPFEGFQFLRVRGYTKPSARSSVRR